MIHEMNLHEDPFLLINAGYKTIEMRLYDEKRKKINVGDIIEFTNNKTLEKIIDLENKKEIIVIRPTKNLKIKRIERNTDKLQEMYDLGVSDCKKLLPNIK